MNVRDFSGVPNNPTQYHVWRIAGPISAFVILVSLAISFSPRVRSLLMLTWAFLVKYSGLLATWNLVKKVGRHFASTDWEDFKEDLVRDVYGPELPKFSRNFQRERSREEKRR